MPQYKLTYFNGKARGETIRMLFSLADQPFEDHRIKMDEWDEFKKTVRFGLLPVLEVDGNKWYQSNTISRMLARRFGFAGKSPEDQARADMVVDCAEDMWQAYNKVAAFYHDPADPARLARLKDYEETLLPKFLKGFESLLEENGDGKGWMVGDSITWADLALYNAFQFCVFPDIRHDLDQAPKLKALFQRIEAHPKIAAWIQSRPKDEDF